MRWPRCLFNCAYTTNASRQFTSALMIGTTAICEARGLCRVFQKYCQHRWLNQVCSLYQCLFQKCRGLQKSMLGNSRQPSIHGHSVMPTHPRKMLRAANRSTDQCWEAVFESCDSFQQCHLLQKCGLLQSCSRNHRLLHYCHQRSSLLSLQNGRARKSSK